MTPAYPFCIFTGVITYNLHCTDNGKNILVDCIPHRFSRVDKSLEKYVRVDMNKHT